MSEKGWIRLDRKILDHWVYDDKPFCSLAAWIDLLLTASHSEKKFRLGKDLIQQSPGQLLTSQQKLSERWGWSRTKVNNFLNALELDGMIKRDSDSKKTAITIVKWGLYQNSQTAKTQVSDRSATGDRQVSDRSATQTIIYNNVNNDNNGDGGRGSKAPTPSATDMDQIVRSWNSIEHAADINQIVEGSERFVNLCECIRLVGAGGITKAIEKVRNSQYLKRKGHVRFDSYMNPNAIVKLLEGAYDEDYSGQGGNYGQTVDWEAVGRRLDQLSDSQDSK